MKSLEAVKLISEGEVKEAEIQAKIVRLLSHEERNFDLDIDHQQSLSMVFVLKGSFEIENGEKLNVHDLLIAGESFKLINDSETIAELLVINKSKKTILRKDFQILRNKDIFFETFEGREINQEKAEEKDVYWQTYVDDEEWVAGLAYIKAGKEMRPHYHTPCELVYSMSGMAEILREGEWLPFTPGKFMYVPHHSIHHTQVNHLSEGAFVCFWFFPQGPFNSITYNFL